MPGKPQQPQLSEEQRAQLKALVMDSVRDTLGRREELQEKAAVMRGLWKALVESPTWGVAPVVAPDEGVPDEHWHVTPTVRKQ